MDSLTTAGIDLLPEVACPNCWHKFPPEAALAVAAHVDLVGDHRLEDPEAYRRFLPTRFTPECAAIDEKDAPSYELACPSCHLLVPRALFERRPTTFISMIGAKGSGKSYLLAALARQMEATLPQRLGLGFTEPHPSSNKVIRWYKTQLFNTNTADALVDIPATQIGGTRHYQTVLHEGDPRLYPRPLFFQVAPTGRHPKAARPLSHVRTLCLYDHSGEFCSPDQTPVTQGVTEHLSRASGLIFVFDPTQEAAFLDDLRGTSSDPQIDMRMGSRVQPVMTFESQDTILATADASVKKLTGRQMADPLDIPLVVLLAKFDAWSHLGSGDLPSFISGAQSGDPESLQGFHVATVERVSRIMRAMLLSKCPSIVATAERFSRRVCYVPVSATGCAPVVACTDADGTPRLKFHRGSLRPIWAEVPLLWILLELTKGLVPVAGSAPSRSPVEDVTP
jgi:hypothetical protein